MSILYYDCFCGISGDMNLGALIDLGVDPAHLRSELAKLPMADEFELEIIRAQKKGIEGTKVNVLLRGESHGHQGRGHQGRGHHRDHHDHHDHKGHGHHHDHKGHGHHHDHKEGHDHHHHDHDHDHSHHHHDHRNLAHIEALIDESALSESVKALSKKIFMEVAVAEAKVHGKDLQAVHFHEVGAVDSIVDIVGAAICFEALGVDKVMSSSVELGGGFVRCDHGMMPVPAPATAEILKGVPVKRGLVDKEMTTPTGAAILKALVSSYSDQLQMNVSKIGYGLGTRDLEFPNVLRVMLLTEADPANEVLKKKQVILETNIDDDSPESWQHIETALFSAGAKDVWRETISMKKGRLGFKLSLLCERDQLDAMEKIIFEETGAIGCRILEVEKHELSRELVQFDYMNSTLQFKRVYLGGAALKYKVENDDLKALALTSGLPLREVCRRVALHLEENDLWKKL